MPPKKALKKTAKAAKKIIKVAKAVKAVQQIKGHGDYRPTQFQRVRGRGDYFGDLLGGLGQKAGNFLQGKFRDITGFGDYRTHGPKNNSLSRIVHRAKETDSQNAAGQPSQNVFQMGAMSVMFAGKAPRIQHREFVCSVFAPENPEDFHTTVFYIQPGLSGAGTLMPWGATVVRNFLEYIFHGGVIEYHSTSSNFSASSALGSVSMSTLYDASESPLTSLASVNNNDFTTSAAPSVSFYHPLECAPGDGATDIKYVRSSNKSHTNNDVRFDDFGIFQLSTSGLSAPAGTKIGELWFSYDIELRKAVLPDLHIGTTAQFDSGITSTMATMWDTVTPDPENSLPAVLTDVSSGGVPQQSILKIQMPNNYNGNYLALKLTTCGVGHNWAAGAENFIVDNIGSDITPLNLLPTAQVGVTSSRFFTGNGVVGVGGQTFIGVFTFSTIANKEADNSFLMTTVTPGSAASQKSSLWILPLDNDITDSSTALAKFLSANPKLTQLTELVTRVSASKATLEPIPEAAPCEAASSVSRSDSAYSEPEYGVLEKSVHIDRAALEKLLLPQGTPNLKRQ